MKDIFFTSDTHFGHDKEFLWSGRGFGSVEEHGEELVKRWNEIVKPGDIVYHLGDMLLSTQYEEQSIEWVKRLNGEIHWIYGNHDSDRRIGVILTLCDNVVEGMGTSYRMKMDKINLYLSHYPTITINPIDSEEAMKKTIVYNLHGHTHQTSNYNDAFRFNNYHVGVDSHNLYPVSWEEMKADLKL